MGLLDVFSGKKHPELPSDSAEASALAHHESALSDFMAQVGGKVEVVERDGVVYGFVGSPPKAFGLVWFDGREHNLKKLSEERGLGYQAVAAVTEDLRAAYEDSKDDPRFSYAVGRHSLTVIASNTLGARVATIIGAL